MAYNALTEQLFVVNAHAGEVDVLDIAQPGSPVKVGAISAAGTVADDGSTVPESAVVNSVAVRADGLVVLAVNDPKTDDGWLVFADGTLETPAVLGAVRVGALPDMVTLTPDGGTAVVANEGEPNDDYSIDPVGSISIVGLPSGLAAPAQEAVRTAGFADFEAGGSKTLR